MKLQLARDLRSVAHFDKVASEMNAFQICNFLYKRVFVTCWYWQERLKINLVILIRCISVHYVEVRRISDAIFQDFHLSILANLLLAEDSAARNCWSQSPRFQRQFLYICIFFLASSAHSINRLANTGQILCNSGGARWLAFAYVVMCVALEHM